MTILLLISSLINTFLLVTILAILTKIAVPMVVAKKLPKADPGLIDLPVERQPTYGDITAQRQISSDIKFLRDD